MKSTEYTIDYVRVGDRLKVTIPELGITVETAPGEVKREDAERVGLATISRWEHEQYKAARQVKAS